MKLNFFSAIIIGTEKNSPRQRFGENFWRQDALRIRQLHLIRVNVQDFLKSIISTAVGIGLKVYSDTVPC